MTFDPKFPRPMLYIGHLDIGQTSLMRADALAALGVPLIRFNASNYLKRRSFLERRIGDVLGCSPQVGRMNCELIKLIELHRPSVVWCDKQEHLAPATIEAMKSVGAVIVFYTPDPYFQQPWLQTPRSNALLRAADLAVTTKSYEVDSYRCHGDVLYMMHGFSEAVHRPVPVADTDRIDIGFIGSWEPRREAFLERCARRGLLVRIWGFGWEHLVSGRAGLRQRARLRRLANGTPFEIARSASLSGHISAREVLGDAYAQALSSSAMSPGLLRTTLYPDQHTTRTFEIPACGTMLIAERTPEHEALFDEDVEAVFFQDEDELVDKAVFYSRHAEIRLEIAKAGRARCLSSGYSYTERLRPVIGNIADRVT